MQHYLQQVTPSILQNTLNVAIYEMRALMRCNKIRNTTNYVFSPFQRCSKIATYHAGATISRPSMQPLCYLPHCRQNLHTFLCETLVFCIYGHQQLHMVRARTLTFAKLKPQSPYIYIYRERDQRQTYLFTNTATMQALGHPKQNLKGKQHIRHACIHTYPNAYHLYIPVCVRVHEYIRTMHTQIHSASLNSFEFCFVRRHRCLRCQVRI